MKIKILKTGAIVDALIDFFDRAFFINENMHCIDLSKCQYEIIPEPPQPKFRIGDKVSQNKWNDYFIITEIHVRADGNKYCGDETDLFDEENLTIYTEPEKPKTEIRYQFIIKDHGCTPYITSLLFADESQLKLSLGTAGCEWIRKIDVPIEVPV